MHRDRPSLRSNFAWTFAGNTVHGASQWAILSLIAKLGTAEMLGQYALAFAVTSPVAMLSHLNLRAVIATDIQEQHPFTDYLAVRMATTAAGLAVIGVLALASAGQQWVVTAAIALVGVSLSAENVSDLYYGLLQRRERMDLIAKSMIGRAILSVTMFGTALWSTHSLVWAVLALAVARLMTMAFYDRVHAKPHSGERLKAPWQVFRTALPLGIVLMLIALTTNLPRYAIQHHLGTRELGAYAAVASFVTVGSTLMNALGQSAITRMAQDSARNRAGFRRLVLKLAAIALMVGAIGVAIAFGAGPLVLRVIYRPEYAAYSGLLVKTLLAGTLSFVAVMLGYAITATRAFLVQMPLLLATAITSAVVSWLLIPRIGLDGAAAAMGAAATVQIAFQVFILRRRI